MNALAGIIGVVAGLAAWLAVGAVGLFVSYASGQEIYSTLGGWGGMLVGAGVWGAVSEALNKKWGGKESLASSKTVSQAPDPEPLTAEVLAPTAPESPPLLSAAEPISGEDPFVCPKCGTKWPTDYCPECATTIRR
jgi:hypothetical protein